LNLYDFHAAIMQNIANLISMKKMEFPTCLRFITPNARQHRRLNF
jgi:hypothetical protein